MSDEAAVFADVDGGCAVVHSTEIRPEVLGPAIDDAPAALRERLS